MATSFFVSRLSLFKLFSLTLIEESWDVCNWFFSEVGATALESSDLLWSEVFTTTALLASADLASLVSCSLILVEVAPTLGWTSNSALADLAWAETIFELAKVEFALVGLVSVEIAESAVFALTPFEVVFVLGAVGATEPTSFFLVSVGVILGLAVAESASCVLFSCTTEDFSTLFTVSALTDWLPMPIVTKPKQTEQRPIVYLRKLNLCSISLLKNDFRLCILHFLVFSKNINSNTRGAI